MLDKNVTGQYLVEESPIKAKTSQQLEINAINAILTSLFPLLHETLAECLKQFYC